MKESLILASSNADVIWHWLSTTCPKTEHHTTVKLHNESFLRYLSGNIFITILVFNNFYNNLFYARVYKTKTLQTKLLLVAPSLWPTLIDDNMYFVASLKFCSFLGNNLCCSKLARQIAKPDLTSALVELSSSSVLQLSLPSC